MAQSIEKVYSPEFDLSLKQYSNPMYKQIKQVSVNGQTFSLGASSVQEIPVLLQSGLLTNFGRSSIRYNLNIPAHATTFTTLQNLWVNSPPISSIVIKNGEGDMMLNMTDLQRYWALLAVASMPFDEYLNIPIGGVGSSSTGTAGAYNSELSYLPKANQAAAGTGAYGGFSSGRIQTSGGWSNPTNTENNRLPFVSQAQLYQSGTGSTNSVVSLDCVMNFKDVPSTILNCEKELLITGQLTVYVTFAPLNSWLFTSTNVDLLTPVTCNTSCTVSNFCIMLAVQQNAYLIEKVKSLVNASGMLLSFPYPTITTQPLGTNSSASPQVSISQSNGKSLLRVISSEITTSSQLNYGVGSFYSLQPWQQVVQYNTWYRGAQLQSDPVVAQTANDAYYINKQYVANSLLSNPMEYYTLVGNLQVDDFSGIKYLSDAKKIDYMEAGSPIEGNGVSLWNKQIASKTATDSTEVIIVIGQKTLLITPNGWKLA